MKKIICLLGLILMMQNGFAKYYTYSHYVNHATGASGGGIWVTDVNVTANYGDSIVFEAYVSHTGTTFYEYPDHWYFNGVQIPNASGNQFLSIVMNQYGMNQYGTYRAYFQDTIYNINFYVTHTTGISSISNINFLNVFPTPVTSSITIQLNSIKTNDIEISFFDMHGRQLKKDFYKNIVGEFIKNENTEALEKGIYFLRIKAGEDVVEKKFVKM